MCLDGRCITITVAHNPSHLSIYNRHVDKKITFSVGVSSKATGRMESATVSELRVAASGCTGASGPRASRGVTVCDSQPRHPPSTREPGRTGCRTVTAQRRTPMEVRLDSHQKMFSRNLNHLKYLSRNTLNTRKIFFSRDKVTFFPVFRHLPGPVASGDAAWIRGEDQRGLRDRVTFQRRRRSPETLRVLATARGRGAQAELRHEQRLGSRRTRGQGQR